MIRRFNYTNRKRIGSDHVALTVNPSSSGPATFDAALKLEGSELPPEAAIFLEAYYKSSYMRFPFGTVEKPVTPADRRLTDIDRGNTVFFRLKIVDTSTSTGRILAEVEDLTAQESGGSGIGKYCLLPVRFTDLGQLVWRLDLDGSRPVLEVNRFDGVETFVKKDPLFLALVFPAAVRQILEYILVENEHDDIDDESDWQSLWLRFAQCFRGRGMRLARLLVGFLLKFFERARRFIDDFRASCGKLLFPLLEGEAPLGGDGVRSGFLCGRLNLLSGVRDKSGYLARQLERRVRGAPR